MISLRVRERAETARSTLCRAIVSDGFRENTVMSAGTVARIWLRIPSRIASSPRFIPPYDPEIPIRNRSASGFHECLTLV